MLGGEKMALLVVSQQFYKDKSLQFLNAVTSTGIAGYSQAFSEVQDYIEDNHSSIDNIETLNMFRLYPVQAPAFGNKGGYTVTVTFRRPQQAQGGE